MARMLADMPQVARDGNAAVWAWLRTGEATPRDVEARLAQGLKGRRGWSRTALCWNYNPYALPEPWWRRVPLARRWLRDRRPTLWVKVMDGKAVRVGEAGRPTGRWSTVRLEAMAAFTHVEPLLAGWTVRR